MPDVKMVVCCKQVPDPEAPPTAFKIDSAVNKVTLPRDIKLANMMNLPWRLL